MTELGSRVRLWRGVAAQLAATRRPHLFRLPVVVAARVIVAVEDGIRAVVAAHRVLIDPVEMQTITAVLSTASAKAAATAARLGCHREQARSQQGRRKNHYRLSHGFLSVQFRDARCSKKRVTDGSHESEMERPSLLAH